MIEVKHNKGDVEKLIKALKTLPVAVNKIMVSSIKRTAKETRTFMARAVFQDYAVKYGVVLKELQIENPTWNRVEGRIHGEGSPGIPLIEFVKGKKDIPSTRRLKRGGYTPKVGKKVLIIRGKGQIVSKGLFLAEMKNTHKGAFKRLTKKRLKISEKFGPSPIKLLAAEKYKKEVDDYASESLRKNTFHEADRALKKAGLK